MIYPLIDDIDPINYRHTQQKHPFLATVTPWLLKRDPRSTDPGGKWWRRASRPSPIGCRVRINAPNLQGTCRSLTLRRSGWMEETGGCQLPKVGNSWEIDVLFWLAWAKYIYIYIIVTNGGYGHRVVWYMWYTFRWPGDCWKLMVQDMAPRICRIMSDLIQWIVHSYVHSIVKCHSLISWKSIKPCYFAISISSFPTSNTARSQRIVQSNIINGNFRILKWRYCTI
jgi:hypothetical protein